MKLPRDLITPSSKRTGNCNIRSANKDPELFNFSKGLIPPIPYPKCGLRKFQVSCHLCALSKKANVCKHLCPCTITKASSSCLWAFSITPKRCFAPAGIGSSQAPKNPNHRFHSLSFRLLPPQNSPPLSNLILIGPLTL